MISDFVLTYIQHIWNTYAVNVFSTWKITVTELPLHNAKSVIVIFYVERTFKAYVCQMCGKYAKTKSEIMKHYKKDHTVFFIPNHRYWDFKPLLEKAKPTSVDSSSDKPKAPIRNVGSQPLNIDFLYFYINLYQPIAWKYFPLRLNLFHDFKLLFNLKLM